MQDAACKRFEQRVRALEAFGHRGSATENEAKAARYLAAEMESSGISSQVESFTGSNSLGIRVLVHLAVAAIGLVFLRPLPAVAAFLGALAAVSLYGEMNTKFRLLGRLIPPNLSHNAVGRIPCASGSPRRKIILCAHLDTQRTGMMWRGKLVKPLARFYQKAPGPMKSPMFPVMFAFLLQTVLGLFMIGRTGGGLASALFWLLIFIYCLAGFLLAEWALGDFVPGACDNATGCAAAIELAERWLADPAPDIELTVLLTGCEETGALGAAAWLSAHGEELKQTSNVFLVVDSFGYGAPRYIGREHSLASNPLVYSKDLLALAEKTARRLGLKDAGPHVFPTYSDGLAFINRGIQGISVLTFEQDVTMPNFHQMGDTSDNMDFGIARTAVEFSWELLKDMRPKY